MAKICAFKQHAWFFAWVAEVFTYIHKHQSLVFREDSWECYMLMVFWSAATMCYIAIIDRQLSPMNFTSIFITISRFSYLLEFSKDIQKQNIFQKTGSGFQSLNTPANGKTILTNFLFPSWATCTHRSKKSALQWSGGLWNNMEDGLEGCQANRNQQK